MLSKKSPGGSIFPYYYKNGELFGAHYESFASREADLLRLMQAEEEFLIKQNHPLPYWVNFNGTRLTEKVLSEFIQSINRVQRYMPRLAIVGCSWVDQWRMKRVEQKIKLKIPVPVRFFSDPEEAKTWLVSEVK